MKPILNPVFFLESVELRIGIDPSLIKIVHKEWKRTQFSQGSLLVGAQYHNNCKQIKQYKEIIKTSKN